MKLGKRPATQDGRDLTFAAVKQAASTALPKPPAVFGHDRAYKDWGVLGNDRYGDCVFAGAAHETMLTNKLAGRAVTFTDTVVLADYGAVTGFDPATGANDDGTDVRDALGFRRATGVQDGHGKRHKIGAYLALKPGNWGELVEATYCFTCVGVGFEFPRSAMHQFNTGLPWDVVRESPIDGGHYVPCVGRHAAGLVSVVTWGRRQAMTRLFYETYCDEAWAMVYPEELRRGKTERGFDLSQLNELLRKI